MFIANMKVRNGITEACTKLELKISKRPQNFFNENNSGDEHRGILSSAYDELVSANSNSYSLCCSWRIRVCNYI